MASEAVTIRGAEPADAGAVAALHTASWRVAYRGILPDDYLDGALAGEHAAHWAEKLATLEADAFVLLAMDAEGLAGFAAVWPDPELADGAFIDNLHARPDGRRRGVGRALMGAAAARLQALGRRQVWLTVYPENTPAVRFYERMGGVRGLALADDLGGRRGEADIYFWRDVGVLRDRAQGA